MVLRVSLMAIATMLASPAASQHATGEANPAAWPSARSPSAITDPATEKRIDALLARMTIEQKVGQTIQADISAITPADLASYPLGSILAGGNSGPNGNERASAAEWHGMVKAFRDASVKAGPWRVPIPILFGVDAVHGHSNLPGATLFPHNIGLGASRDTGLIRRIGAATAAEVAASGIEWTFAPTLAVPQDLRWGRTYEGYSSSPELVKRFASAMTLGLQGVLVTGKPVASNKVAATIKHFIADGGTLGGKDQGDAVLSEAELVRLHAPGYPAGIDAGALTAMVSFSSWNGIKHHGNKSLLTDVFKQRMGFNGLLVGDWNAHGQVPGCTNTDCPQALNAGLDLYMAPDSWKGLFDNLLRDVKAGEVPMARLNDAVRRILRVKVKLGLLDGVRSRGGGYALIGAAAHRAIAREAVAKSLVLLKNEGGILPIKPGARVLVTGDGANSIGKQSGGWTITWQGTGTTAADFAGGTSIYAGIAKAVASAGGSATLSADGSFVARPDVAIVVYGEDPYAEFQGDVPTLDYQPAGAKDLALLRKLKTAGIPVVSVFLSGRPLFTSPEINASNAFVAAWLPGSEGAGVADVLVADRNGKTRRDFTGKLSFAWPATAASPIVAPLFKLGHGLSYRDRVSVPMLSEEAGVDMMAALSIDRYFAGGRALSPWTMGVSDPGGTRPVGGGTAASPTGTVSVRPVDLAAQEDGRQLTWSGRGGGTVAISGPFADLSRHLAGGQALVVDWRIDTPPSGRVSLDFGERAVDITPALRSAPSGTLVSTAVPLRCFVEAGADIARVGTPFAVSTEGTLAFSLARVRLAPAASTVSCPAKFR
ncbi:MAG: exo 1,3/1,4-beta-D-glucan glucohydrolase [Sphingomicrobium sp.]